MLMGSGDFEHTLREGVKSAVESSARVFAHGRADKQGIEDPAQYQRVGKVEDQVDALSGMAGSNPQDVKRQGIAEVGRESGQRVPTDELP